MRIFQGIVIGIFGTWVVFAGFGLLFWLGDFWGGVLSDSPIPEIIYFGGAPIILVIGLGIVLFGVYRAGGVS